MLVSNCDLVIYKNSLTPLLTLYEEVKEILNKNNFEFKLSDSEFQKEYENHSFVKILGNQRLIRVLKLNKELKFLGFYCDIHSESFFFFFNF
jgi:hypothetical protein